MAQVKRAYEVERVDKHTLVEQVAQFEDTGEKTKLGKPINRFIGFKTEKRTVEDGYMVYFPRGHSIYVENDDALKRLRMESEGGLIDMDTGLPHMPNAEPASLKDAVSRATQPTRGVDDVIKELE
jgi:hypothetical protein